MSTFSGISTALSALYAQRRGLDTTGQNIANANTDGYSRQRVDLASVGGPAAPALYSIFDGSGGGVEVTDVARLRDQFLETRARNEHGTSSYLDQVQSTLSGVESVMNEPSDTGLASQLGDLWASFHDLTNRPGDNAARTQVLERANTVARTLNQADVALQSQWSGQRTQADAVVAEVNNTAQSVADLNQAINRQQVAGVSSNDLEDKRDLLVMKLSELTGATARNGMNGSVDVFLGGRALVRGGNAERLTTAGAALFSNVATTPVAVNWTSDAQAAPITGGTLGGLLQGLNVTLPSYSTGLDNVAASLANTVNAVQTAGFDLAGTAGTPMFTGTTAATIAVAISDPKLVAASKTPGGNLDGSNADALAAIGISSAGPDNTYSQLVVNLGVESQTATRRSDIQTTVVTSVDAARDSVAGVNLDEEMTNMITFQRAYEGASRVLTTIDSTLDTLINRTGLVGR
jgi:flagellar hook-associated protein 1 FlgK